MGGGRSAVAAPPLCLDGGRWPWLGLGESGPSGPTHVTTAPGETLGVATDKPLRATPANKAPNATGGGGGGAGNG